MFYCGAIMDYNNMIDYINYLKKNTNYRGISCIQALDLISIYYNSQFYDENNKNDKKIMEHKICGLILDTWNIKKYSTNLGSCSCYYKYSLDELDRLCIYNPITSLAFSNTNNAMFSFWKNQIK